jgi:hypothetical protein
LALKVADIFPDCQPFDSPARSLRFAFDPRLLSSIEELSRAAQAEGLSLPADRQRVTLYFDKLSVLSLPEKTVLLQSVFKVGDQGRRTDQEVEITTDTPKRRINLSARR